MDESRQHRIKKILKYLLIFLVVLSLGLPIIVTGILKIPYFRVQTERAIINHLNKGSSWQYKLEDLYFEHNALHLKNLIATAGVTSDTVMKLGQVEIKFHNLLRSLWTRQLDLQDVSIKDSYFKIVLHDQSTDAETKKGPLPDIDLQQVQILKSKLSIEDCKTNAFYDFSIFEGAFDLHKIDLQNNDFASPSAPALGTSPTRHCRRRPPPPSLSPAPTGAPVTPCS